MQFTLCNSLYALHSMHFTLCTSLYALHSMHFTLCTSLYALQSMLLCQGAPHGRTLRDAFGKKNFRNPPTSYTFRDPSGHQGIRVAAALGLHVVSADLLPTVACQTLLLHAFQCLLFFLCCPAAHSLMSTQCAGASEPRPDFGSDSSRNDEVHAMVLREHQGQGRWGKSAALVLPATIDNAFWTSYTTPFCTPAQRAWLTLRQTENYW